MRRLLEGRNSRELLVGRRKSNRRGRERTTKDLNTCTFMDTTPDDPTDNHFVCEERREVCGGADLYGDPTGQVIVGIVFGTMDGVTVPPTEVMGATCVQDEAFSPCCQFVMYAKTAY